MTGEEIRSVVREKIRRGEWPSPGGMAGLRKGWEKTWMKKKKG